MNAGVSSRLTERIPLDRLPVQVAGRIGRLFGQIALRRGYVSPQLLAESLEEQRRQFRRNDSPLRLGQILIKRKAITQDHVYHVLREQQHAVLRCGKCKAMFDFGHKAVEAQIVCLNCGEKLSSPGADTAERVPKSVGRYRILREIARGGMGVVYEAEDPDLGRKVALKVVRDTQEGMWLEGRLRREALLLARVSHPNIVRIYEVATLRESPEAPCLHYIAMEYIEGANLDEVRTGLGRKEKVRILEKVASALEQAHQQGILHRDLKPANVLLSRHGEPIVIDFGLSRWIETQEHLTYRGEVLGTLPYMAPEQFEENGKLDARTDVWALGVMMYELLSDRLPFPQTSPSSLFEAITREEPAPLGPGIDGDLKAICAKAMEKDSRIRYASAGEMARDLHRWGAGLPIQTRSRTWKSRIASGVLRHRTRLWWVAVVFALGVLVGWIGQRGLGSGRCARSPAMLNPGPGGSPPDPDSGRLSNP